MRTRDFVNVLTNALSHYDKAISQDITPTSGWTLKLSSAPLDQLLEDVRFLPKRLRSVYVFSKEHPELSDRQIAKRLGLRKKTVLNRLRKGWITVDRELKAWLKRLPVSQRRREIYRRRAGWRQQQKSIESRVRSIWPDMKVNWPSSKCSHATKT